MKKLLYVLLLLITFLLPLNAFSCNKIKVGFYQFGPYYYYDKNRANQGYYDYLLKIISKDLSLDYEYVDLSFEDCLKKLENGEIDLLFGLNKTPERENIFSFSEQYISNENFAIFTNKKINYADFEKLENLKFGFIPNEINNEYILKLLESKGIHIEKVNTYSYSSAENLLKNKDVDFIVSTVHSNISKFPDSYFNIFEFSCGPSYIATSKKNVDLISKINCSLILDDIYNSKKVYNIFFNKYFFKNICYGILILILLVFIIYFLKKFIISKIIFNINLKKKKNLLNKNLLSGKYVSFYQPIVDSNKNEIIGIESLIRGVYDNKIISPDIILKEFNQCNMMFDLSIWLVNNAIKDYYFLKSTSLTAFDNIYISVNISFLELENDLFLKELILISKRKDFIPNTICLEIVEKFTTKHIDFIKKSVCTLKKCGYLIALDDFGVEYSNLDLLTLIDSNIIKIDKYFLDDITENLTKQKILNFVCELSRLSNKSIVCEGIENKDQVNFIKNLSYKKIYIQGYYYSKPVPIQNLIKIKI